VAEKQEQNKPKVKKFKKRNVKMKKQEFEILFHKSENYGSPLKVLLCLEII